MRPGVASTQTRESAKIKLLILLVAAASFVVITADDDFEEAVGPPLKVYPFYKEVDGKFSWPMLFFNCNNLLWSIF